MLLVMNMSRTVVTIDGEGRICLPPALREALHWEAGTSLGAEVLGSGALLLQPLEGEPLLVEKGGVLVVRNAGEDNMETALEALRTERLHSVTGMWG